MGRTALLMLFLSICLSYASVSAANQERDSRYWLRPSGKKCMEYSEKCTRVQQYCVPIFKHLSCSEWNDRCNRYNQLCPKLVRVVAAPPQQVVAVPQQIVAVPQQVVAVPQQVVPQQVIVQQPAPQKIKFKLFG
ncbi:hypothetical protein DAPPUDRAFT_310409 [Daphnia pulex]|uniref:Uncharacterized protein n=1 Tax=Daphnia pulex TaxID=6669 RepID=E9FTJ6_DAPPU|nr:hypothetical protein DAPPUDRAFT_310409 [Daphnia pulex]|eukprot:EFX89624.1 hypothetical protein DAPPUDRAFT_310409 [Daphnia pulex]